jgi:NADPH:quinone reductase-like Zn-dependent oxidoreductase
VDNLELSDVPEPGVAPGQVKVRVVAGSINPLDRSLRRGDLRAWMPLDLPAILGRDVAGEVIELGGDVRGFEIGDRVLGMVSQAYAEVVVAPAECFAKLPPELEMTEASALPLVGLTGAQLIEEQLMPRAEDLVLVTGAVGAVGRVAVYALKQRGARVIAGVRASQKQKAEALDAEMIVALDDSAELEHLPELDGIADTVGGETIQRLLAKLKVGGTLATTLDKPDGALARGVEVRTMLVHPDSQRLGELAMAYARGQFELPIDHQFDLADVRRAHETSERHGIGKVLLRM